MLHTHFSENTIRRPGLSRGANMGTQIALGIYAIFHKRIWRRAPTKYSTIFTTFFTRSAHFSLLSWFRWLIKVQIFALYRRRVWWLKIGMIDGLCYQNAAAKKFLLYTQQNHGSPGAFPLMLFLSVEEWYPSFPVIITHGHDAIAADDYLHDYFDYRANCQAPKFQNTKINKKRMLTSFFKLWDAWCYTWLETFSIELRCCGIEEEMMSAALIYDWRGDIRQRPYRWYIASIAKRWPGLSRAWRRQPTQNASAKAVRDDLWAESRDYFASFLPALSLAQVIMPSLPHRCLHFPPKPSFTKMLHNRPANA